MTRPAGSRPAARAVSQGPIGLIVFPLVAAGAGYGSVWPVNGNSVMTPASAGDSVVAARQGARTGLLCGLAGSTARGFIPLYFRAVSGAAPPVVLCHRVFWSVLFLAVVVSVRREWG